MLRVWLCACNFRVRGSMQSRAGQGRAASQRYELVRPDGGPRARGSTGGTRAADWRNVAGQIEQGQGAPSHPT